MLKQYLMTPGPTMVPERVLLAMAKPIIHHRTPAYAAILEEVRGLLKELFCTKQEVLIFASTGTGAMEASVCNLLSPGDRALCIRAGKFGERWTEICEAFGVEAVNVDVPWGQAVDPGQVDSVLAKEKNIKVVFTQATETSTGAAHPIKQLVDVAHKHDAAIAVDGITGVGVFELPLDEWGIDALLTGSQKALMLPPGLGLLAFSERAWKMAEQSKCPKFYFSCRKELKKIKENSSAYTSPVSLVVGLLESLKMMKEEGFGNVYARHDLLARATRAAVKSLGLGLYAPDSPSNALTAAASGKLDGQKIVKNMRDVKGIAIAGGQDQAKGKIFRISHMGYVDGWNILMTIGALEQTLKEMGHSFEPGIGMKTALQTLSD